MGEINPWCIIFSSEYPQIDSVIINPERSHGVPCQSFVSNHSDYNSSGSYPVYKLLANPTTPAAAYTMPIMTYCQLQHKPLDEMLKDPFHQSPMWGSTPIQQMPRNQSVAVEMYGDITYSDGSQVYVNSGPKDLEINHHSRSNLRAETQSVVGAMQDSLLENQNSVENLELKLSEKVNILRYVCSRSVQNQQWDKIAGEYLQLGKMTTAYIRGSFKHFEPMQLTENERTVAHSLLKKLGHSSPEEPSEPGLENAGLLSECEEETFPRETENGVAVIENEKMTGSSQDELLPVSDGVEIMENRMQKEVYCHQTGVVSVTGLEVHQKHTILRNVFQRNVNNMIWDEEVASLLQLDKGQVELVRNTYDYEEIIQLTPEESLVAQCLTNKLHQLRKDTPIANYPQKNTEIVIQYMINKDIYVSDDNEYDKELVHDYGFNASDAGCKMANLRRAIANGKVKTPLPFTIAKVSVSEIVGFVFRRRMKSGIASQFEIKRWPVGNPRLIELRKRLLDLIHTKNSCVLLRFELNQLLINQQSYRTTIRAYEYLLEDIVTGVEENVSSNLRQDLIEKLSSTTPRFKLFDDIQPERLGLENVSGSGRENKYEKSRSQDNEFGDQIHEGKCAFKVKANVLKGEYARSTTLTKRTSKRKHKLINEEGEKKRK